MALSDFTQYALEGVSINNPTSIEFGPDGRLYMTQQDGLIKALTVEKKVDGGYSVVSQEVITLVKSMPNHNDDGTLAPNVTSREVTGVVTTTNALGQVVLYVSSSDFRIAGGSSGDDSGLDTNSSTISRLTLTDSGWEKVDIVRGLPRSEENHAANGLQLTEINGVPSLLVAVGGITNSGAQGNNFAHTNEYYYSAAIVKIDLDKIAALEAQGLNVYAPPGFQPQYYVFDLPTLDDPTRPNDQNGDDISRSGVTGGGIFGGNDGLNQAIYDPTGTVEVYSPGYRNSYDIVVTQDGKLYTYDNGPNSGWGGLPVNANGEVIVDLNQDGIPDNGPAVTLHDVASPGNAGASKPDHLHLIDVNIADGLATSYADGTVYNSELFFSQGLGYYGGHPNITRAYGTQGGFYLYNEAGQPLTIVDGNLVVSTTGPVDLGPLIANWNDIVGSDALGNEFIDPRQAIYLSPKPNDGILPFDGSLHSIASSTNGLAEYTWSGDELKNALLTVSFNGNLTALILDSEGRVVSSEARGIGGNPLDVTAQGDGEPFAGTIWVATHGSDKIFVLDPEAGQGVTPDPTDRDQDDVEDTFDPFAADPHNGLTNVINGDETLIWEFVSGAPFPNDSEDLFDGASNLYNGFDIGFTGIMTNGTGLPESFYDQENLIAGGAPGAFQIKRVEGGNPFDNTLRGAYQFGLMPGADTGLFTISTTMDSFFDEITTVAEDAKLLQGLFAGSGDMNNFVYIAAVRQADGTTGIEVAWEFERPFQSNEVGAAFYQIDDLASPSVTDSITVSLQVDATTGLVTPKWSYTSGGQAFTEADYTGAIASVQLEGPALEALSGTNALDLKSGGSTNSALAVGILASNSAVANSSSVITAVNAGGADYTTQIDGETITFLSDKAGGAANAWVKGPYKSYVPSQTFDIQGTDLDTMHLSERSQSGTWGYAVPVTEGGLFELELFFAEIYFGAPGGGAGGTDKRLFKIKIEGEYLTSPDSPDGVIDIYELAGGAAKELLLSHEVQERADDGNSTLDIEFETVANQAKLSGFILREIEAANTFAADWENIVISGEKKDLSSDDTPPSVSIDIQPAPAGDAQFVATVTITDTVAVNFDTVTALDLVMSGPGSNELVHFEKSISGDGKTVTATYSFGSTSGGWIDGDYFFTLAEGAIADAAGNENIQTTATAPYGVPDEALEKGAFVLAVNFNGPAIAAEDGIIYQADEDNNDDGTAWLGSHKFVDGQFGDTVGPITNVLGPQEEAIYKTARYGGKTSDFSYTLSNLEPDTDYVLTLKFAETWYLNATPGKRVFDVLVNDELVIDDLDLLARAGMHVAFDKDVLVRSDGNGVIKLTMPTSADNAQIAALALHLAPVLPDPGPTAVLTYIAPKAANEALVVAVTYDDATGVDTTTIDETDLVLLGATASDVSVTYDEETGTALYTFQPPSGGWNEGSYRVELLASAVFDMSSSPNGNLGGVGENFTLDFPNTPPPSELPKGAFVMAVNINGPTITTEDGITYQADEDDSSDGTAWKGSHKFTDGQFGDTIEKVHNVDGPLDAELYKTARYGGKSSEFSYTLENLEPDTDYVLTLKFAEIWYQNATPGKRVFDVFANSDLVIDDLDLVDLAGLNMAYDKDVFVRSDGNGVIKITMPASADNAQIAALALHEINPPDTEGPVATLTVSPPQEATAPLVVTVAFDDETGVDATTVDVSDLLINGASPAGVSVSYEAISQTAVYTIQPPEGGWGSGLYEVSIAEGAVFDSSPLVNANGQSEPGSFTLDFPPPMAHGPAPTEDLDGDGVANHADPDIDGDGSANGDDPFSYDSAADGHGIMLAAGASLKLDFSQDGTPYQNGFTGVMASSNSAFKTEDTGAGVVSGGKLRVTTTAGDTGAADTPQNNYQLGVRNASFAVEAIFDNPYFDGSELPNNFEQLGLQVSLHSDAFVKFVFGSPGANLEFSQDAGTNIKTAFPDGYSLLDFAAAKLGLAITSEQGQATATATITLLSASGQPLNTGGPVVVGTLSLDPTLVAALLDGETAVGVGVTSTHTGGDPFEWSVDDFTVTEGGYQPPAEPQVEQILRSQTGIVTSDVYAEDVKGLAVLKILPGVGDIQASNYSGDSFILQNVGDKKIAAVFIDVRSAIYSDSVFDPDGSGGDQVTKDVTFSTNQSTGAIAPATFDHFFFAARSSEVPDPLYSNSYSDSGKGAGGGYRGLLLKFGSSQGGFQKGESIGFASDMDPNSIAGLLKGTVDNSSVPAWDVGGISGAELIGSRITVMFSDGTIGTGQLMGDGSQAGAQALIMEVDEDRPLAHLTVNDLEAGQSGFYGGVIPEVLVSGTPGETVRVVMTRGFDPVESQKLLANGAITVDALVEQRLAAHAFSANNAADFQTIDVVIPASGTIDVSSYFQYNIAPNGNPIPDFDRLQLGFVAAVIDPQGEKLPLGPLTEPIYLKHNGIPIVVDGAGPPSPDHYRMNGSYLKVQLEDIGGMANPPSGWVFQNDSDGGKQAGFQGNGYYYWQSELGTGITPPQGVISTTFYVENAGTYNLRLRSSRDSNTPGDQRNDIWVKVDGNTTSLLPPGTKTLASNNGFVKLFGAGSGWGYATKFDTLYDSDPDVTAKLVLQQGFHTISFAGRSQGFHADFFELYLGTAPALTAANSPFIPGAQISSAPSNIILSGPGTIAENQPGAVLGNLTVIDSDAANVPIFTTDDPRFEIVGQQLKLKEGVHLDYEEGADTTVGVTASDSGGFRASQTFVVDIINDPSDDGPGVPSTFVATVQGGYGDIEQGSSALSSDLETNKTIGIQFTIPAGVSLSAGATIESAIISWISDRTHTATSTLTFSVENKLNGASLTTGVTNRSYLAEKDVWQTSATWADGEKIIVGVDLADQINDLILSDGLSGGDVITIKIEGSGGTRYIEAAGSGRSGPELAITYTSASESALLTATGPKVLPSQYLHDISHSEMTNQPDWEHFAIPPALPAGEIIHWEYDNGFSL